MLHELDRFNFIISQCKSVSRTFEKELKNDEAAKKEIGIRICIIKIAAKNVLCCVKRFFSDVCPG